MGNGFITGNGNIPSQRFVCARQQPGQDFTSGQAGLPQCVGVADVREQDVRHYCISPARVGKSIPRATKAMMVSPLNVSYSKPM